MKYFLKAILNFLIQCDHGYCRILSFFQKKKPKQTEFEDADFNYEPYEKKNA